MIWERNEFFRSSNELPRDSVFSVRQWFKCTQTAVFSHPLPRPNHPRYRAGALIPRFKLHARACTQYLNITAIESSHYIDRAEPLGGYTKPSMQRSKETLQELCRCRPAHAHDLPIPVDRAYLERHLSRCTQVLRCNEATQSWKRSSR